MAAIAATAAIVAVLAGGCGYAIGKGKSEQEIKELKDMLKKMEDSVKFWKGQCELEAEDKGAEREYTEMLRDAIEEGKIEVVKFIFEKHQKHVEAHKRK